MTPMAPNWLERALTAPWLLAGVVLLVFYWQLGAAPLYDLDEGAFTEATREMLASGNFITPHKDGMPRYDKPILIYWLQAASVRMLGFDEFALRLPSALAASLWVLALWIFVRAQLDARTATVAGLLMALSLQVPLIARAAVADALLNLFLALALFEIWRYVRPAPPSGTAAPGPNRRRHILLTYLWMGLGFLTKGPVAIFFPALIGLLWCAAWGTLRHWWRAARDPLGWLILLAVALPWYVAVYLDDGAGFFRGFFLEHNIGRFGAAMHGHAGFPGYYLIVLPLLLLPFTGWFLSLLPGLRAAWADPLDRFLWLWFATVLVTFSCSGTQLPHYLLYGATPLFILMARHRDRLTRNGLAFAPPLLFAVLLATLPVLLALAIAQSRRPHELALLQDGLAALDGGYWAAVLGVLAALTGLAFWTRPPPWQRLILAGLLQWLAVYGALAPRVLDVMQGPVREAGRMARELALPTVVYRTSLPSFSVYRQAITPHRPPHAGELVFLRVDRLARLKRDYPELRPVPVYRRGSVTLVRLHGIPPAAE